MSGKVATPLHVRWPKEGPTGRCAVCGEFWPLTREFWAPHHGLARCRACHNDVARERQRAARQDPDRQAYDRHMNEIYRRQQGVPPRRPRVWTATPEAWAEYQRRWHLANRDRRNAAARARYAARKKDQAA